MKVIGYCCLHYGREWLYWSVRSVLESVDEFYIFYTPTPSHGHSTTLVNPESFDEIKYTYDYLINTLNEFHDVCLNWGKVYWVMTDGFVHEGYQRTYCVNYCESKGADIVLVVDADELWEKDILDKAIDCVSKDDKRSYRVNMRHFYRSIYWYCDDAAMPTRLIKPAIDANTEEYLHVGSVYHMGYAQSPSIVYYKQSIHGHKAEWRNNWYNDKFLNWVPGDSDVHPTCTNYWTPVEQTYKEPEFWHLYDLIYDHPYIGEAVITDESFNIERL